MLARCATGGGLTGGPEAQTPRHPPAARQPRARVATDGEKHVTEGEGARATRLSRRVQRGFVLTTGCVRSDVAPQRRRDLPGPCGRLRGCCG